MTIVFSHRQCRHHHTLEITVDLEFEQLVVQLDPLSGASQFCLDQHSAYDSLALWVCKPICTGFCQ
jgi:hypothetical protein